jgi:hypothetical protein
VQVCLYPLDPSCSKTLPFLRGGRNEKWAENSTMDGNLDNRFGALFELRRLQWPKYEGMADAQHFNQGIAGFFDNILLPNYSLFREDMRIRSGNVVRVVERRTSESKLTLLDGDLPDGVDTFIIVSFDSQRTGQQPNITELTAIRKFLEDPDSS